MKTFIHILIYFCITLSVSAQNTDIETTMRYGFFTYSNTILPLDNGETIIVGDQYESGGWGYNTLRLDKLDASGDLIWTKTYPQHVSFYYLFGTAVGTDNSVYLGLARGGCDYFENHTIMKFDSEGNHLWSKISNDTLWSEDLKATADGGIWALTNLGLYKYDSTGSHVQTIELPFNAHSFDYNMSTEEFIVPFRDDENVKKIMWIGADGSTQEIELIEQFFLPRVYFWDDYILAKYYTNVLKYDQQLNLIDSIELSESYPILDFDNEYIYLSNRYNTPIDLLKLNEHLEIIDSMTWHYGNITDIEASDNYLYILGEEYKHTYLKEINKDFTHTDINTDIGVVNILGARTDSTCLDPSAYYCSAVCQYDVTDIQVVVKNFGTETINYFELNALYNNGCLSICYDAQPTMMIYDNVNIAPGDTYIVDFPPLNLWNQLPDAQLCLYTTRPNKLLDKEHDNDEICRNFFYDDTTSIHLPEEQLAFSIFPNPATAIINLQNTWIDWQKATVHIISIEGKQLAVQAPEIDISTLPTGVYVVHCEYEGVTGSERFVKYD